MTPTIITPELQGVDTVAAMHDHEYHCRCGPCLYRRGAADEAANIGPIVAGIINGDRCPRCGQETPATG